MARCVRTYSLGCAIYCIIARRVHFHVHVCAARVLARRSRGSWPWNGFLGMHIACPDRAKAGWRTGEGVRSRIVNGEHLNYFVGARSSGLRCRVEMRTRTGWNGSGDTTTTAYTR